MKFGQRLRLNRRKDGSLYQHEKQVRFEWRDYFLDPMPSRPLSTRFRRKRLRRLVRFLTCAACGKWYEAPQPTLACSQKCRVEAIAYARRKRRAA